MPAFATDFCHVGSVTADRLAAFATDLRHVVTVLADRRSTLPSDFGHVNPVTADRLAAFASDARHVATVLAYDLPTFASRFASLVGRKLMRPSFDVGRLASLACDLALPLLIHRGKSAPRSFRHDDALLFA